ncbi:uncharacterized protein EI97DRAFT_188424 [Westerdykella ornata]|uniref:Uncharacterized protein n=1 Tax=Westerdykella ornata TaxID=318751 RepID=A0A6A6J917_WESOR|nr:uncharacterized protein EI97DRAFT_188424 [Westerdykella ornata]KAF2273060.1 hypothetical protein EI97DRAFT_188424 [Westerdykella ornata]
MVPCQLAVDANTPVSEASGNTFSASTSPEAVPAGDHASPSVRPVEQDDDCEMSDAPSVSDDNEADANVTSLNYSTGTAPDGGETPKPSITLMFSSYEEADRACPGPAWTPVRPDNTLPKTQQDRVQIVIRLLEALQNRTDVHDRAGSVYGSRWQKKDRAGNFVDYYDPAIMEKVCWDVLKIAEEMHTHQGASHLPFHDKEFNKCIYKTKDWTFGTRIDWMVKLMRDFKSRCEKLIKGAELALYVASPEEIYTTSEQNRKQNDKRQGFLKAGREISKKEKAAEDGAGTGAPFVDELQSEAQSEAAPKPAATQPKSTRKSRASASRTNIKNCVNETGVEVDEGGEAVAGEEPKPPAKPVRNQRKRTQTSRAGSSQKTSKNTSSGSGDQLNQADEVEAGRQLKKTRAASKKASDPASKPTGVRKQKRKNL